MIEKEKIISKLKSPVLMKHKKVIISLLTILIIVAGGWLWYSSQPKSIMNIVIPKFKGYDGDGRLEYNSEEVSKEIAKISYRKVGFSKTQSEDLANGDFLAISEVSLNSKSNRKYRQAQAMISGISYEFSKVSHLSNGEKVVLKVSSTSSKSPIKNETKTFTVKGLKNVEKVSAQELLKDYPASFKGFNGYGVLVLKEDSDGNTIFESSTDGHLKNGDTVKLNVYSSYADKLKREGKSLKSKKVDVKVSGLKELTEISNLSDGLAKNDKLIKSHYENSDGITYTIEKDKDYISYDTYSDDSSSGEVKLITVYKITENSDLFGTTVEYNYYGYSYYLNKDNTLDLDNSNSIQGNSTKDLDMLSADLETDGYKEYKAE
ncbi:hypothetical protein ACO4C2_01725 [Streptococcus equinus]|uniref:hypothetical protein n=1 Tax=Streptococcus equinus TaxID=1335 RepID=UPI003C6F2FEE